MHGPCEILEGTLRYARQFLSLMNGEDHLTGSKGSQLIQGLAGLYMLQAACLGFICTCSNGGVLIQLRGSLPAPCASPVQLTQVTDRRVKVIIHMLLFICSVWISQSLSNLDYMFVSNFKLWLCAGNCFLVSPPLKGSSSIPKHFQVFLLHGFCRIYVYSEA